MDSMSGTATEDRVPYPFASPASSLSALEAHALGVRHHGWSRLRAPFARLR